MLSNLRSTTCAKALIASGSPKRLTPWWRGEHLNQRMGPQVRRLAQAQLQLDKCA